MEPVLAGIETSNLYFIELEHYFKILKNPLYIL